MRNMLAFFAAVLLTVIGAGWYLGWYKVSNQPASVPGQHSVKIDIDTHKIGDDLQKGEKKIEQIIKDKTKDEGKALPDAKKASDSLMLPTAPKSPQLNVETEGGSSLQLNGNGKGPLFQFHGKNGASLQIESGKGGPFIQFGAGDKKE